MNGEDLFFCIFYGAVIIGVLALVVYLGIVIDKQQKEEKKAKINAINLAYSNNELPELETVEVHTVVINQYCSSRVVGIKNLKAIKEFFVCFKNDNGKEFNLTVPEDAYDGFEIGMSGILTMVDGQLYSFIPDNK